jgi:hypothetical protein
MCCGSRLLSHSLSTVPVEPQIPLKANCASHLGCGNLATRCEGDDEVVMEASTYDSSYIFSHDRDYKQNFISNA